MTGLVLLNNKIIRAVRVRSFFKFLDFISLVDLGGGYGLYSPFVKFIRDSREELFK